MLVKLHDEFSLEANHIDSIMSWTGKLTEEHKKASAVVYIGCKEEAVEDTSRLILVSSGMFHCDTLYAIPDSSSYGNETVDKLREAVNMAKRAFR
jgi:late competence protein required for DNA uptake (superfamily II DNA/RNA helicase)